MLPEAALVVELTILICFDLPPLSATAPNLVVVDVPAVFVLFLIDDVLLALPLVVAIKSLLFLVIAMFLALAIFISLSLIHCSMAVKSLRQAGVRTDCCCCKSKTELLFFDERLK